MPRPNARRGKGGSSRSSRPSRAIKSSPRRQPKRSEPEPVITPETLVSLSPKGRVFVKQLLEAASVEAGREITNHDMLELMRRVRAELGTSNPDFRIPAHMECLMKNLRALGKEPPTPPTDWARA